MFDINSLRSVFPITGFNFEIKVLSESDFINLYNLRRNPEVMRFVDAEIMQNHADALNMINYYKVSPNAFRCVVYSDQKEFIGTVGLYHIDFKHRFGSLGFEIDQTHWGKGYGKKIIKLFTDKMLQDGLIHRIEAQCHPENHASAKTLTAAGFKQEAVLRENFWFEGKFENAFLFSKLSWEV